MALRLRCLRFSDRVNFADEILETLIAKTEARSQRAERIHYLVEDLRNILEKYQKKMSSGNVSPPFNGAIFRTAFADPSG